MANKKQPVETPDLKYAIMEEDKETVYKRTLKEATEYFMKRKKIIHDRWKKTGKITLMMMNVFNPETGKWHGKMRN